MVELLSDDWSPLAVQRAVQHPLALRMYGDAPYVSSLFDQRLWHQIQDPRLCKLPVLTAPFVRSWGSKRYFLPGTAAELVHHTSLVVSQMTRLAEYLEHTTHLDYGPPLIDEMAASVMGHHTRWPKYWSQMAKETKRRISGGYCHVLYADVARCIENVNVDKLSSMLISAGCQHLVVRQLDDMHQFWNDQSCNGVPLTSGFRIFIKLSLKPVDDTLRAEGIEFLRLQDDYRLFAESDADARHAEHTLMAALADNGFAINRHKTFHINATQHSRYRSLRPTLERIFNEGLLQPALCDLLSVRPLRSLALSTLSVFYDRRWSPLSTRNEARE